MLQALVFLSLNLSPCYGGRDRAEGGGVVVEDEPRVAAGLDVILILLLGGGGAQLERRKCVLLKERMASFLETHLSCTVPFYKKNSDPILPFASQRPSLLSYVFSRFLTWFCLMLAVSTLR